MTIKVVNSRVFEKNRRLHTSDIRIHAYYYIFVTQKNVEHAAALVLKGQMRDDSEQTKNVC